MVMDERQPEEEVSYAKTSPFVRLLGRPGRVQILDVFLRKHYTQLTAAEVAELADIARTTFHRNIEPLIDYGIINLIDTESKANRYELNSSNPISKTLRKMQIELLEYSEQITGWYEPLESRKRDISKGLQNKKEDASFGAEDLKLGHDVTHSTKAKSMS